MRRLARFFTARWSRAPAPLPWALFPRAPFPVASIPLPPFLSAAVRLAVFPLALLAASCGPGRNQFAPVCPVPAIMIPLSNIVRARDGSPDVRDLAFKAKLVDVRGACEPGDGPNVIKVRAQVVIDVTRGLGMIGDTADLPVFMAVVASNSILDKKLFTVPAAFRPGSYQTQVTGPQVELTLSVSPTFSGAGYVIAAGFQLTPEEAAAAMGKSTLP